MLQWEWNKATNFKDIYDWKGLSTKPEKLSNIKENSANTYTDIKRAVSKHWDLLKINRDFEQSFSELSTIAFIRNRNLQDILGKKTTMSKYWSKWLFEDLQLQVKKSMMYTNAINKYLQTYSHTQSLQNIQWTQFQKQMPSIPNGMRAMKQTIHR